MDKQTGIKIAIVAIVAILAIAYYFSSHKEESENYDNLLADSVVANHTTTEEVVEEKSTIKVYVTGEVNNPGVIELEEGARIQDAIEAAGGIKPEANLEDVNLAYEVEDGEKIYIPNQSEESTEMAEGAGTATATESLTGSSSNSKGKININKATASELTAIPGVGESTAQKIVAYREENGKFKAIEDIKNVSGIGDSKFNNIKDYIAVK